MFLSTSFNSSISFDISCVKKTIWDSNGSEIEFTAWFALSNNEENVSVLLLSVTITPALITNLKLQIFSASNWNSCTNFSKRNSKSFSLVNFAKITK